MTTNNTENEQQEQASPANAWRTAREKAMKRKLELHVETQLLTAAVARYNAFMQRREQERDETVRRLATKYDLRELEERGPQAA